MKYKTIDLCAGIGGIRRGFELTGKFQNILSAEVDAIACKAYKHLYGDNASYDLTSDIFKNICQETDYDVLLAGFPCQTFSRAGQQLGFRDQTKGTIFFHIVDIIKKSKKRPKVIFLENVDNLIRHDHGNTFRTIIEVLTFELNYKIIGVSSNDKGKLIYDPKSFVRNSKNFGIPQNRPRVYIIGFDNEYYRDAEFASYTPEKGKHRIYTDINDLLDTDVSEKFFMSSGYLETLKRHAVREKAKGNGFGYKIINKPEVEHPIANTILATGGSGKERNLIFDKNNGHKYAGISVPNKKTPINKENIRVMTPSEWGKLQGFINYAFMDGAQDKFSLPDDISDCQKYKLFGNSVTIPVIQTMAEFILNQMDSAEEQIFKKRKIA